MATKIYIDQGHNPVNPNAGAEGNGYREQDISYAIGIRLADILNSLGYETRLSRNDPDEILGTSNQSSLSARVNDANAWGADYFISLHTNASASPAATGTEALVYSLGSRSANLASSILDSLTPLTGLRDRGVIARPGLYVLRRTKMPAVLIEMGFITNRRDAELMANSPEIFAEGIANGIVNYVGLPTMSVYSRQRSVPRLFDEPKHSPLPPPAEEKDSATDPEEESDTRDLLSYDEFIRANSSTGYLKIQAFRGNQVYPVQNVRAVISKKFSDGDRIFFEGVTDENGIIDEIPLPAPARSGESTPEDPGSYTEYELTTAHEDFEPKLALVTVFGGVHAVLPLLMILKEDEDA